jgi:hypothetical protein
VLYLHSPPRLPCKWQLLLCSTFIHLQGYLASGKYSLSLSRQMHTCIFQISYHALREFQGTSAVKPKAAQEMYKRKKIFFMAEMLHGCFAQFIWLWPHERRASSTSLRSANPFLNLPIYYPTPMWPILPRSQVPLWI